ncbi:GNAT family N-acetyltransferase [Planctomycetota bacterium]|nr:GNAT family N-acetyltransferase [Planctomycetota bacterium]
MKQGEESPLRSRTHNTSPHRLSEYLDDRFTQLSPLRPRKVSKVSTMPVISTEDYVLRPQNQDDLPHIVAFQRDPVLMRYFGGPVTPERARHRFNLARWHYHAFGYSVFTVLRSSDKEFAGFAGLVHLNFDFSAADTELVICLTQPNWNHHMARELGNRLMRYAFEELEKDRIFLKFEKRDYPLGPVIKRDFHLKGMPQADVKNFDGRTYEVIEILPGLVA